MFAKFAFVTAALIPSSLACLASSGGIPAATATHSNTEPIEVAAGQVFDGQLAKYDRGSGACSSGEGGQADAVFIVREGGTLKNVIIGADQQEGVYCLGSCTLEEVWFEDVCEDAISIKEDAAGSESWIIGGGAYNAGDKIVQHNGCGKVNIVNFYAENYGKVYRSCGNCETQCARTVSISGVTAKNGGEIAGINENYGDTATLTNVCADTTSQCVTYSGCAGGCSPEKVGTC